MLFLKQSNIHPLFELRSCLDFLSVSSLRNSDVDSGYKAEYSFVILIFIPSLKINNFFFSKTAGMSCSVWCVQKNVYLTWSVYFEVCSSLPIQKLAKVICLQTRRGIVGEQETFSLPTSQAFFQFLGYYVSC